MFVKKKIYKGLARIIRMQKSYHKILEVFHFHMITRKGIIFAVVGKSLTNTNEKKNQSIFTIQFVIIFYNVNKKIP